MKEPEESKLDDKGRNTENVEDLVRAFEAEFKKYAPIINTPYSNGLLWMNNPHPNNYNGFKANK